MALLQKEYEIRENWGIKSIIITIIINHGSGKPAQESLCLFDLLSSGLPSLSRARLKTVASRFAHRVDVVCCRHLSAAKII